METITRCSNVETVALFDGGFAFLRPIEAGDADLLRRFHAHLSRRTVHMRFFGLHLELADAEVERFTNVDGVDRVALVVATATELIAVGRYDKTDNPCMAEVAFVVADDYQHHGLGTLLLDRLARRAREVGISTFSGQTLHSNGPMLAVLRGSGYPMTAKVGRGVIDFALDISSVA